MNLGPRIKDYRKRSGLTVRELARQVKVSPSFVSQIENGKSQPSVATLYAFSQLLHVSVDDLFEDRDPKAEDADSENADTVRAVGAATVEGGAGVPPPGDLGTQSHHPASVWQPSEYANRISIVHPAHRSRIEMAAGVIWERLAATPEHNVNFMQISYAPGASSTDSGEMSAHSGYEYGVIASGRLEVTIGDEVFTLNTGESLGFDSSIPHTFRNPGPEYMRGVWFVHGVPDPAGSAQPRS